MPGELSTSPGPTLVRFQEVNKLLREMEERFHEIAQRAYQRFEQRGRLDGNDIDDWFKAESDLLQPVPIEIEDRANELVIHADVPGFKPEELEVAVEPSRVLISGRSESRKDQKEKGKVIYSEQKSREISRSFALPHEVIPEQAAATLKDGQLQIKVTKAQAKKSVEKKVPVRAA